jgi:hypothetical protein
MLTLILTTYLALNMLVILSWGILFLAEKGLSFTNQPVSSSALLRLHYFTLSLVIACTFATPLFPGTPSLRPAAQVWSAPSIKNFNQAYANAENSGYLSLQAATKIGSLETNKILWISATIAALLLLCLGLRLSRDFISLLRMRRNSFRVKKIRGVSLIAHDEISVPFT